MIKCQSECLTLLLPHSVNDTEIPVELDACSIVLQTTYVALRISEKIPLCGQ